MRQSARDVRSDRLGPARSHQIIIFFVTLALLLWPVAANRTPFYTPDSASYLRGGDFGFEAGIVILQHWWQGLVGLSTFASVRPGGAEASITAAVAEAGGIRSPIYSVITHVLRGPGNSLIALAVAQAAAVAFVFNCLRWAIAPRASLWPATALGLGLAGLTTAPWYAAYAMPDIFAGIVIAVSALLAAFSDRFGIGLRVALVLLAALSITVHGSHLPIALAALLAGGVASVVLHRTSLRDALRRAALLLSPIILAIIALLGTSYLVFGEASLSPKRYPIQLARSIADGPGAWHLRDHCATERYAICEIYGPNPPRTVREFLWSRNGVRYRATPEQMERIRAEESTIVRRAAMEYPGAQLKRSATNIVAQFFDFGTDDLVFGERMVGDRDPSVVTISPDRPALKTAWEAVIYAIFAASLLVLFLIRRRLTAHEAVAISTCAVGLLANAAVCGILSGVTDRYQGRVAWVLPALAMIIWLRVRAERRPAASRGIQSAPA